MRGAIFAASIRKFGVYDIAGDVRVANQNESLHLAGHLGQQCWKGTRIAINSFKLHMHDWIGLDWIGLDWIR